MTLLQEVQPAAPRAAPGPSGPWEAEAPHVYLYPGELFAAAAHTVVSTILGTCVALCLWDEEAGAGGLNHYLLPGPAPAEAPSPRFGPVAVEALLEAVLARGARLPRLRAKVFGGVRSQLAFPRDLGTQNAQLALAWLHRRDIPLLAIDVGGERGRKLVFQPHDGRAWVRHL